MLYLEDADMISSLLNLGLTCVIILGIAWLIIWILHKFTPAPAQVDNFIWLVAALICVIKLVQFLGF